MNPTGSSGWPRASGMSAFDREVGDGRRQMSLARVEGQRHQAPGDHDHAHDRGRAHDLQRLVARFVNAPDVDPPEIDDDADGDRRRAEFHLRLRVFPAEQLAEEPDHVLSRRHAADRAGQQVVEHQSGDRQRGHLAADGFLHHSVDASAHEHRAVLDVDAPNPIAEQHDGQDEPGRRLADVRLDDPADVIGRAGEVAQDDGGGPPE